MKPGEIITRDGDIVINQNSGSSEDIDESQHSAIANSASPFKEWMYTEPYA